MLSLRPEKEETKTMINKKNIGKQLKELRLARGLRQAEVAGKVGLSRATISNVEVGNRGLSLESLQKFCELYQVDISYFGIEVKSYDEAVDLTARLQRIFESDIVDIETKDELYTHIMELYLNSKKNNKTQLEEAFCH